MKLLKRIVVREEREREQRRLQVELKRFSVTDLWDSALKTSHQSKISSRYQTRGMPGHFSDRKLEKTVNLQCQNIERVVLWNERNSHDTV